MKRKVSLMRQYGVTFSRGGESDTYTVEADSERDAEIQAGNLFWRAHPELDIIGENEGLKIIAVPTD